eukprot:CAMPEP_0197232868 /NCGR_PEP_ID=MMETSP1429-20130617/1087_1 /TAXON_ID=49237 /ORGANISM="Chaetoceros  sp., Strain UNC1202" /LENGTH=107 /DNA_ID=CAMNT_0042691009 /DNA_START=10 /DNA_END=333 /DNA_ORIENTATION=+
MSMGMMLTMIAGISLRSKPRRRGRTSNATATGRPQNLGLETKPHPTQPVPQIKHIMRGIPFRHLHTNNDIHYQSKYAAEDEGAHIIPTILHFCGYHRRRCRTCPHPV